MLPLLAQLHPGALTTGPPVKRPRLEDGEDGEEAPEPAPQPSLKLLGLPPDVLEIIFRQLDDDPGVPMLLVRRVKYYYNGYENAPATEDVFYMRLPDPKAGPLDEARFEKEGYTWPGIMEGLVDVAGYDYTNGTTQFLRFTDEDGIPDELIEKPDYDDFDYTIFDVVDDATYMLAKTIADGYTWRNTRGERLLFDTWPTFKSYVAIVLLLDKYNVN